MGHKKNERFIFGKTNPIRAAGEPLSAQRGTPATAAGQRETRTIPIVFAAVGDPVANGLLPRLDRPSGNITGFAFRSSLPPAVIRSYWVLSTASTGPARTSPAEPV
jgi:hypothetical protein